MTDTSTAGLGADVQSKARHRAMWALGEYPAVAADVVSELGPTLVAATCVRAGDRVRDVAAGASSAAMRYERDTTSMVTQWEYLLLTARERPRRPRPPRPEQSRDPEGAPR